MWKVTVGKQYLPLQADEAIVISASFVDEEKETWREICFALKRDEFTMDGVGIAFTKILNSI